MSSNKIYNFGEEKIMQKEIKDMKSQLGLDGQNSTLTDHKKSQTCKKLLALKAQLNHQYDMMRKLTSIAQGEALRKANLRR